MGSKVKQGWGAVEKFSNLVAHRYHTRKNRGESNSLHNEIWLRIFTSPLVILHTICSQCPFFSGCELIIPAVIYILHVHHSIGQIVAINLTHSVFASNKWCPLVNLTSSKLWVERCFPLFLSFALTSSHSEVLHEFNEPFLTKKYPRWLSALHQTSF